MKILKRLFGVLFALVMYFPCVVFGSILFFLFGIFS
jgi:hypothetical protein